MQPDAVAMRAPSAELQKVPLALSMDVADAPAFLQTGQVDPAKVQLQVGTFTNNSVQNDPNRVMMLLSDAGKARISQDNPDLVERELKTLADGGRSYSWGAKLADGTQLVPSTGVKQILAGEQAHAQIAPAAKQAGLSVTRTEDFHNALLVEEYGRTLPGFADLPGGAKGPVAGLTEAVASRYPSDVPLALRRQIAYAKVSTHATPRAPFSILPKWHASDVRPFSHGTTMGRVINLVGFPGDLQAEWDKLPGAIKEPFKDKVKFVAVYGSGTYTGNNSVAASYAAGKLGRRADSVQVVSGKLKTGEMTTEGLDKAPAGVHTQVIPDASGDGAYYVTRGRKWLLPERITSLDEKALDPSALPAVVGAYEHDPIWAARQAALIPDKQLSRGLEPLAKSAEPRIRDAAGMLKAIAGDPQAIAQASERMVKGATAQARDAGAAVVAARTLKVGPGHPDITRPLMQKLLAWNQLPRDSGYGSPYGSPINRVGSFGSFGSEFKDLFDQAGLGSSYQSMVEEAQREAEDAAARDPRQIVGKAMGAVFAHLHF